MRGQGSLETLVAVGFMLFLFLTSLSVLFRREREVERVDGFLANRTDCDALVLGASAVFTGGEGTSMRRTLANHIQVESGIAIVGDVFCISPVNMTNGTSSVFTLEQGEIEITSIGEEVLVENV